MRRLIFILLLVAARGGLAQSNAPASSGPAGVPSLARQVESYEKAMDKIRGECIHGRRTICGRIERVLPDGLMIDSGYVSLMRAPLDRSWLIPGTVAAKKAPDLVEGKEPDDVCAGLVFLTDTPKSRLTKPKAYDYVVLHAYPAGEQTCTVLGSVTRTLRRFSASLPKAVELNCRLAGVKPPALGSDAK